MSYPYKPMQPIVSIGLVPYPDGVVHWLPYTFGVRAPYPAASPPDSEAAHVNKGFGLGAEQAAFKVGAAGLIVGTLIGILGLALIQRLSKKSRS